MEPEAARGVRVLRIGFPLFGSLECGSESCLRGFTRLFFYVIDICCYILSSLDRLRVCIPDACGE